MMQPKATGRHVATVRAYPLVGGGYRAALITQVTVNRPAVSVFYGDERATLDEARYDAKKLAHDRYAEQGYALAAVRRKGQYYANVWTN